MGLSSLRRHRGGYVDRQLVHREPTKDELAEQLAAEKAKTAALEAQLAASVAKPEPEPLPPVLDPEPPVAEALAEQPTQPALEAEAAPKPNRHRR